MSCSCGTAAEPTFAPLPPASPAASASSVEPPSADTIPRVPGRWPCTWRARTTPRTVSARACACRNPRLLPSVPSSSLLSRSRRRFEMSERLPHTGRRTGPLENASRAHDEGRTKTGTRGRRREVGAEAGRVPPPRRDKARRRDHRLRRPPPRLPSLYLNDP
ncbi:hypothetical protein VTK73DRAFT_2621 [Phialemonium thermophilum]|uniref:Uncharacterized protein n=1 Tax=Phialemonium thermophilum TaxID=223376 RepID=A0ABR3VQY8_9PEZI